jgi:hypothetical protein
VYDYSIAMTTLIDFYQQFGATIVQVFVDSWVFWLPVLLGISFFHTWMSYTRAQFIFKQGSVLLEIKLPKDIMRSPAAMELIFIAVYQTGSATLLETYLGGKVRPWFSFEMASFGGDVHFYIWTVPKFKGLIEAQIYAQYPTAEIYEVDDYTTHVYHDLSRYPFWATYFKLSKADAYPIKTYIDYGLDKSMEEEEKIDPLTSVLEYLGALGPNEEAWIQIIIQAHKKEGFKDARLFSRPDWTVGIDKEIEKVLKPYAPEKDKPKLMTPMYINEIVEALHRSKAKFPFEVCMRGFYIPTKGDAFNSTNISGLIGSVRQYSSNTLNGLKLGKFTDYDYPWQDFQRKRRNMIERKMLEAYKRRSFFQEPFKYWRQKPFILNTEELATIYHFPGGVATTPTLTRIPSRKSEPPANLPL